MHLGKDRFIYMYVVTVTMLSGARNHRDFALSQKLYDRMKSLFPDQKSHLIAASVLVSNTYSSVGDEQQAQEVRISRLKQLGSKIKAGLSWTEVNGELVVSV
jgi:glycine betaine/choline ABC-type transport system substrate-binding protein